MYPYANVPYYIDLHIQYIFTNFPGVTPPEPHNWEGANPSPYSDPSVRVHHPTFESFRDVWMEV